MSRIRSVRNNLIGTEDDWNKMSEMITNELIEKLK